MPSCLIVVNNWHSVQHGQTSANRK